MSARLAGTGPLLRLALRRARVQTPIWILVLLLTVLSTAVTFKGLYPTVPDRERFAATIMTNSGLRALYGVIQDPASAGSLVAWRLAASGPLALGLMNLLLAVRYTRGDEEAGRAELIGAQATGRYAPIAAALGVTGLADLALAVLIALTLALTGLPVAGSALFGLSFATTAWVFAAVAAVTAQLGGTARAAGGLAGAVLGLTYLIRAVGDGAQNWLVWASPFGWAGEARAFAGNRWWLPLLELVAVAVLVAAAVGLRARRDLGASLFGNRTGPATASRQLSGPIGLAWRLQRATLLAWALGLAGYALLLGALATDFQNVMATSSQLADIVRQLGGTDALVDAYFNAMLGFGALCVAGYTIQAALRPHAEETDQRAELVLSGAVGRSRWVLGHILWAAVGSLLLLAVIGLGLGLGEGLRSHDLGRQLPRILTAALLQAPAAWLFGALVLALIGAAPRLVSLGWAAFAACLLIAEFGPAFKLPQQVLDASPFALTPLLGHLARTGNLLILLTVSLGLGVVGLLVLRRRDLLTG